MNLNHPGRTAPSPRRRRPPTVASLAGVACLGLSGCVGETAPTPTGPLSGAWDVSSLSAEGTSCVQALSATPSIAWQMNPDAQQWAYDDEVRILASLDDGGTSYAVDLQCLVGATQQAPELGEGELRCFGEIAGLGYQPSPQEDAAFALQANLTGRFSETLVCTSIQEYLYDFTAFYDASWRVTVLGACEGADCEAVQAPTGDDGGPLCVQGLSVTARWSGCEEEGNTCLTDDQPSSEAPCL